MGAFTVPKPTPNITYASNSRVKDVVGDSVTSRKLPKLIAPPATMSDGLAPKRPTTRPERDEKRAIAPAMGNVSTPARSAESPRTSCRYKVFKKRNPPKAKNEAPAITVAPEKGTLLKKRSSISGS